MDGNAAVINKAVHELIAKRWSPRSFDPNRDVAHKDLIVLLEAARWAPSCFNAQPWRFIVCQKSKNEAHWKTALDSLVEKNRQWAKNAPILMLVAAVETFSHNGKPNRWAMYDTGAASLSLSLQATAMGLIVHQMGGFDAEKSREAFNLPEDCRPMAMMAMGYQSGGFEDGLKAPERSRVPLKECFYLGTWGRGIET